MGPTANFPTALSHVFAVSLTAKPSALSRTLQTVQTEAKNKGGRPPRPAALKRSVRQVTMLTPLEAEAQKARAQMAGMKVPDYIRQRTCGSEPEELARRSREVRTYRKAEATAPGDFDALVARFAATMPRANAETLAKRELARGR